MTPFLITADAVLPMDAAPILEPGGIVVQADRIVAVGSLADLRRKMGQLPAMRERYNGVLMPGLVNAHTHLELGYQRNRIPRLPFTQWVAALMTQYPAAADLDKVIRTATQEGADQSLRFGVTTVGDISRHCTLTRECLRTGPLRVVSFGEVVGLGKMRERFCGLLDVAGNRDAETAWLTVGISPHAPYTVEGPALMASISKAIITRRPVAMHLAELAEERDFLRDQSGPLGRDWDLMLKLDVLDGRVEGFGGGPIRWGQMWGLLINEERDFPVVLAHVNYCSQAELAQLAACKASVAYCPRTAEFFGHTAHRYRDMLAAGINVCLATDSLASNPDLSVLSEAQFLKQRDGTPAAVLLEMITWRGARALGMEDCVGTLTAGKFADFIVLPMKADAEGGDAKGLMDAIVGEAPEPLAVWVGGDKRF